MDADLPGGERIREASFPARRISESSTYVNYLSSAGGYSPAKSPSVDVPEKVVAARVSADTIDELAMSSVDVAAESYWHGVTHLVYSALVINSECEVSTNLEVSYLKSPQIWLSTVCKICSANGIKLVWSLYSYADDSVIQRMLYKSVNVKKFWASLLETVEEFGIEYLEIDLPSGRYSCSGIKSCSAADGWRYRHLS